MLINKVSENGAGGEGPGQSAATEYRTASELFDLMTRNISFDSAHNSLSAQELVLLYQNIDLGTRLMNDANELAVKKPNQYVETVVYNDLEDQASDSDSEMYTNAEIHDVFAVNQERLDFINNTSLEHLLCHKLGGVAIHTSDVTFDYDKNLFFQDPYINNQLRNFNAFNSPSDTDNIFSTSLIDYICCKRLEDNYNFYMDNIIRYVQHTIDQLKRISNGDYLTDRAKEKWREVISSELGQKKDAGTKVIATSTSIPLHVECKAAGKAKWDELVRSEVDVRSLSKILEKKIIVEIPKLLCGSYRLYSKRCADNLIISCKKEEQKNSEDSRVDVVLKLERSQTGEVISNISSIMILKTVPALPDLRCQEILPLPSSEQSLPQIIDSKEKNDVAVTIIEVIKNPIPAIPELENENAALEELMADVDENEGSYAGTNDYPISDRNASCASIRCSSGSSIVAKETDKPVFPTDKDKTIQQPIQDEYIYNIISPHELQMSMRKLNMKNSTLEESAEDTTSQSTYKKRSPIRVRIKSPYENKSFSIEEKKRKRLLEIRERREKRKLALSESCKITKHKYAKGPVMPQASSSVTKLSITNRSFYNSIYGQNMPVENKARPRKSRNTDVSCMDETNEDCYESPMVSPNKNSKQYVNRSHYLDEAETEVTYMQRMKSKDIQSPHSTTNSIVSTEFGEHLELFKQLIIPSETNLTNDLVFLNENKCLNSAESEGKPLMPIAECENKTVTKTPHSNVKPSGDECRRSIDQLYELMKQLGKQTTPTEGDTTSSKVTESNNLSASGSIHGSESGSSVKHSPRPNNIALAKLRANKTQTPVAPKSAMASKLSPKAEVDKGKKERKRVVISPIKGSLPENPLKAISQLLHEFENVQRKPKSPDLRHTKKPEVVTDSKSYSRPGNYRRRSRLDQHTDNEQEKKSPHAHNANIRDKRTRPVPPPESARGAYSHIEDRNFDRVPKKKIADIIDEAKEARGEAVRGPSKFPSRLDSLAQPKKCYVQAHVEEYQSRFGRNMILAERLQKLATTKAPSPATDRSSPVSKNRWKKHGSELAAGTSVKQRAPSVPLIEQHKRGGARVRPRRSASSSPVSPARRSPRHTPRHSPRRKRSPTLDMPQTMGKKVVAVESYLKSQYRGEERQRGLRCRVPFVPHDIEIASLRLSSGADESTSLSTTLHHMFDSVVGPGLTALAECSESRAPSEPAHSDSDYCVNILEDRYVTTAVGLCTACTSETFHPHHNSNTEMEKLESALYTHISGSFQKRLRTRNPTLTPKTSMQQVFLLQSGDTGSLLVKSISNIKLDRRSAKSLHELKPMSVLSNTHVDWRFSQIPMQIATVGYAFTQKQSHSASGSRVHLTDPPIVETREHSVQQTCQSSQCFRGLSPNPFKDASAQVDIAKEVTTSDTMYIQDANECDAPNGKKSTVNSEMNNDAIFFVNETCNDDKTHEIEDDTTEEEAKPSQEYSSTVPAAPAPSFVTPEYTTSLDMLVGLLNEIQKITCQNQIASSEQTGKTDLIPTRATAVSQLNSIQVSQLKTPRNVISLTSIDNLSQLESNASIFTYYISNNDTTTSSNNKVDSVVELKETLRYSDVSVDSPKIVVNEHVAVEVRNPTGVDKEVSANICNDSVNICTNVPSSMHAVMCSAQSVASVRAYHICSNNTFRASSIKKIIELPQIETNPPHTLITRYNRDLNDKRLISFAPIRKIENVKTVKSLRTRCEIGKYCVATLDLDPMFKFKRDVLVSVYSVLVLTIFAALSFPELLMFQS